MFPFVKSVFLGLVTSAVCLTAVSLVDAAPKKPAKPANTAVKIVGTWKSQYVKRDGQEFSWVVEIHEDNTYSVQVVNRDGDVLNEFGGEYTYKNGQITMTNEDGPVFAKAKVTMPRPGEMVFTYANGYKLRWSLVEDKDSDKDGDEGGDK